MPGAPKFTGRSVELHELRSFWEAGPGVLSLVGAGGAGKTALCEQFLQFILSQRDLGGLFVWSFYDDPDANVFLRQAHGYFSGHDGLDAKGTGWFHALKDSLAAGGKHVIVLDGLERIQRPITEARGVYGELEDPLLRGLLRRLVTGVGQTKAIITSRFPVSDLESWLGTGYTVLDVDQLDIDSAKQLLQARGVIGSEPEIQKLVEAFGRHALTLDLLAGLIESLCGGDLNAVELPEVEDVPGESTQSKRLAHLLNLFLERLDERKIDLLVRMCVFRFGVSESALTEIFVRAEDKLIAGALAGIEPDELRKDIEFLESLHLVHSGGDSFTVHPAVRDHFYRVFRDPDGLHHAISTHLMTLTGRPGVGLPTENSSLDLLEELVYHALKAGKASEASHVYFDRMGGNDHLNVALGEYIRTFRLLKAFPECPDPSAMYHCLRSFGRFEEALSWRAQNKYILLLEGELAQISQDPSNRASRIAWFLRGESTSLPERLPDFPFCVAWLLLYRDSVEEAKRVATTEIAQSLYLDDIMRNRIALAEAERRQGHMEAAEAQLAEASEWVLRSCSHEHLCLMHGVRASLAMNRRNWSEARTALDEAMQIAKESQFRLLEVDFLTSYSELYLREGQGELAVEAAERAYQIASSAQMGYVWGQKSSLHAKSRALIEQGSLDSAVDALRLLIELQRRLDDPALPVTERQLSELVGQGSKTDASSN